MATLKVEKNSCTNKYRQILYKMPKNDQLEVSKFKGIDKITNSVSTFNWY